MNKVAISIHPEACTLCRNCQLICSFINTGFFNPFAANIQVEGSEDTVTLVFLDTCKRCGLCAQFCVYGAIQQEEPANG